MTSTVKIEMTLEEYDEYKKEKDKLQEELKKAKEQISQVLITFVTPLKKLFEKEHLSDDELMKIIEGKNELKADSICTLDDPTHVKIGLFVVVRR